MRTFFVTLLLCAGCEAPPHAARGTWHSTGKADDAASCAGACGGEASAGCWCDDLCTDYGDCCPDKARVCDCQPASCQAGQCGQIADGCGGTIDCGPCAPPPPPRQVDLFDPALSSGTPTTPARMYKLFSPGSTWAGLGGVVIGERTRQCNLSTGCGPWTPLANPQVHMTFFAVPWDEAIPPVGTMGLWTVSQNGFRLDAMWPVDTQSLPWGATATAVPLSFTWGPVWPNSFTAAQTSTGIFPYTVSYHGQTVTPRVRPDAVGDYDLAFTALVTDDYVYALYQGKSLTFSYEEVQYAVYGRIAPGESPTPAASGETIMVSW
jgi:hypothetical protein